MRIRHPGNTVSTMVFYERRLPLFNVVGEPIFLTFRLYGSLPRNRVFPASQLSSGQTFVALDRILDRAQNGPRHLGRPEIAQIVENAILDGDRRFQRYDLHASVIMPNHVHMLITPHLASRQWLGPLKGFTAHEANRILGQAPARFWQDESYDDVVRSEGGRERVRRYIENNPVKAGLALTAEDFRWSSAKAA